MQKVSQQEIKRIQDLYLEGLPIKNIMSITGRSKGTVWNSIVGMTNRLEPIDQYRNSEICKMYLSTRNTKLISKKYNISQQRIYQILHENNIDRLTPELYPRKYDIKLNYFETLNLESAYWLGFILADGCIHNNTLSITLSIKDKNHLERFRKSITNCKLQKYNKILNKKTYELIKLTICSKQICNSLRKLGITERKSLIHGTPDLPSNLMAAMYLGYFDGDGSISKCIRQRGKKYRVCIAGSEKFCIDFQLWVKNNIGVNLHLSKQDKIHILSGATEATIRLLTFLYSNSNLHLERKFEIYKKAIKEHDSTRSRIKPKLGTVWHNAMNLISN